MVAQILSDPTQQAALASNPAATVQTAVDHAKAMVPEYYGDKLIYRIVVSALALTVLGVVFAYVYLSIQKIAPPPEALVAIGSGALGGLTGLLMPSPGQKILSALRWC
jgi:formate hydrogenlyase subunit 4